MIGIPLYELSEVRWWVYHYMNYQK